jgi:hypothetical protein
LGDKLGMFWPYFENRLFLHGQSFLCGGLSVSNVVPQSAVYGLV